MTTSTKATFALFGTIFIWAYMAVLAKDVVGVISPMVVLFFRLAIASLFFLPFFLKSRVWKKPGFARLALISLSSTVNLTFFLLGLKYTSASVSQLIYAAMPILILIYGRFTGAKRPTAKKIMGVMLGFSGLLLIGIMSSIEKGETITGSLLGNVLIMIATLGWTTYLLNSKKLSKDFNPIEMGSTSILVSFIVASLIFVYERLFFGSEIIINPGIAFSLFYIGFAGTFLTYLLYQYAIRHSSALKVSLAAYIQPVVTTAMAMAFIGEKLTIQYIIGSIMILSGVALTNSFKNSQ